MRQEKTIRGDRLLLAFQCIQRTYAAFVANPLEDDLPARVWNALEVKIDHPYGYAHWYGEIALRAPTHATLARTMTEKSRGDSYFYIDAVASRAVRITSSSHVVNGLSRTDRRKLRDHLAQFLCLVACGEISEQVLLSP